MHLRNQVMASSVLPMSRVIFPSINNADGDCLFTECNRRASCSASWKKPARQRRLISFSIVFENAFAFKDEGSRSGVCLAMMNDKNTSFDEI